MIFRLLCGEFKIGGRIISVRFADYTPIIAKTKKKKEKLQDMVNRLVGTGRKFGMEINSDNSQVTKVLRIN